MIFNKSQLKTAIVNSLRKLSWSWNPRKEALKGAFVGKDGKAFLYKCKKCGGIFKKVDVSVDHIVDVVPVTGWDTWDGYIERLFCDLSGFQVLCNTCHSKKTSEELTQRVTNRKIKKGNN